MVDNTMQQSSDKQDMEYPVQSFNESENADRGNETASEPTKLKKGKLGPIQKLLLLTLVAGLSYSLLNPKSLDWDSMSTFFSKLKLTTSTEINKQKLPERDSVDQTALENPISKLSVLEKTMLSEATQSLETLKEHIVIAQKSLAHLQAQVDTLEQRSEQWHNHFKQLNDVVQPMKQWYQAQLEQAKVSKRELLAKQSTPSKPIYYLHAIIPGRAWLATEGSKIVTVSVGDQLPGYGVIELIDAEQGRVELNTGLVLSFAPN